MLFSGDESRAKSANARLRVDSVLQHLADRFEIKGALGSGAYATVYRAFDKRLEREVAVKILHMESAMDPDAQLRFEREAKTLCSLNHPNIVRILSFGLVSNHVPYMVSEFLDGNNLKELLFANGALSAQETKRLALEACKGLQFMHEHSILHRDLKPDNVFVCKNGDLKLIDLGLCGFMGGYEAGAMSLTSTGIVVGTVGHMSPEQIRGEKLDGRSDLYSLGCVIYECLINAQPFSAEDQNATMVKQMSVEPDWKVLSARAPAGSEHLMEVVKTSLRRERQQRFQTANDFSDALKSTNYRSRTAWSMPSVSKKTKLVASAVMVVALGLVLSVDTYLVLRPKLAPEKSHIDAKLARQLSEDLDDAIDQKRVDDAVLLCEKLTVCSDDHQRNTRDFLKTAYLCVLDRRYLAAHTLLRKSSDPASCSELSELLMGCIVDILQTDPKKAKGLIDDDIVWLEQSELCPSRLYFWRVTAVNVALQSSMSNATKESLRKATRFAVASDDLAKLQEICKRQLEVAQKTNTADDAEYFMVSISPNQRKKMLPDLLALQVQCDLVRKHNRAAITR